MPNQNPEQIARDKIDNLLGLTDLDNLSEPDEIASEIIENLEEGIAGFRKVLEMCGE